MANTNEQLIVDEMSQKIIDVAAYLATTEGAHNVNVRKILNHLGITNRVFYNHFRNIEEVLNIISKNSILEVRKSLKFHFDENKRCPCWFGCLRSCVCF